MSYENSKALHEIKGNAIRRIKNRNHSESINCCKEYTFIKKAQIISFNNKMNDLGITHLVLDEYYNQTDILIYDITMPVKFGAPIIIGIIGYPRAGKSEGAQLIYFFLKKANKKHKNRDIELFLCWKQPEFLSNLKLLKKGDVVWTDEQPRTMGIGARKEMWQIDNVMHSIAKRENGFIFVTPKMKDIKTDICDLYLETAGQNRKTRMNRFMILDDERRYFGHVYLKLHDNQKFRDWYEKQKDEFINDISKHPTVKATIDKSNITDVEFEEINEELEIKLNFANENYIKLFKIKKNKERDIMIWKLYNMDLKDKEISNVSGIHVTTVRQVYNKLEDAFKKELKPKLDLLIN